VRYIGTVGPNPGFEAVHILHTLATPPPLYTTHVDLSDADSPTPPEIRDPAAGPMGRSVADLE